MTRNQIMPWILACMVFTIPFGVATSGEIIEDPKFNFRMTIPDGFKRYRDREQGDVIYTFARPPDTGDPAVIQVMRMRGVIRNKPIDPKAIAKSGVNASAFTVTWKSLEVDVVRTPVKAGDNDWVVFNVQIPLRREAVQVSVGGPIANEAELRKLLTDLLADLNGEIIGTGAPEPSEGGARGSDLRDRTTFFGPAMLAGLIIFLLLAGLILFLSFVLYLIRKGQRSRK